MVSDRIKVCHIVDRLNTGGMENGVVNLCNGLDRNQFEAMVIGVRAGGQMAKRFMPDVRVLSMGLSEGKGILRPISIAKLLRREGPDIVHTHGWGGALLDGVLGGKLARVSAVINGEHGSFFLSTHQVVLQKILFRMCNQLVAVSEALRERISEGFGISPASIRVIHNGVDTELFNGSYDKLEVRRRIKKDGFNIESDEFVVGYVGSLRPVKNIQMLLDTTRQILDTRSIAGFKVLLVGEGPDSARLQAQCRARNLHNNVFFLGQRGDLPALYSAFDAFVLCSQSEGMSNVLLEAMSSGVPAVCTEGSDVKRVIVRNGYNGFVVENDDRDGLAQGLLRLSDSTFRSDMGRNARRFVCENYSLKTMLRSYQDLYGKAVHGRKR